MTIKMWLRHKKFVLKQWVKAHQVHFIAVISTVLLLSIAVEYSSQALAKFIESEFIQPAVIVQTQKLSK